jgi:hypothetical protein
MHPVAGERTHPHGAMPGRDTRHDGTRIANPSVSERSAAINDMSGTPDWRAERIREWLLLLLRFAVTWDQRDQTAALAVADQLDALGLRWRPSAPDFFCRTTHEVCHAITALDDPKRTAILKKHLERIEDPRLRHAFRAAVGF